MKIVISSCSTAIPLATDFPKESESQSRWERTILKRRPGSRCLAHAAPGCVSDNPFTFSVTHQKFKYAPCIYQLVLKILSGYINNIKTIMHEHWKVYGNIVNNNWELEMP